MDIVKNSIIKTHDVFYFFVAVISASLYGTVGYYGTQIIKAEVPLYNMLFWRFGISAILLLLLLYFITAAKVKFNLNFFKQVLVSAAFYTVSTACCFHASREIGIGLSMSIFFIFPIFNVVFIWLSNNTRVISRTIIYSMILSALGLYFIGFSFKSASINNFSGVIFAMVAAFSFALYIFLTKKCVSSGNTLGSTLAIFIGNSLVFLILSFKDSTFIIPHGFNIWQNILMLSVVSTILPTVLMIYAMAKVSSAKIAITSVFEPVCALLIGSVFLSEAISNNQITGIFVIIASNILLQTDKSSQNF